jgi:putative oxidoreductase
MGAMKKIPCIAALLLGLAFVAFGLNFWLHFLPSKGAPAPESFVGLMYGSGYLAVIKALEVLGGVLLILPRTRVLGLFLVGAILFNIACVHQFFFGGLKDPTVIGLIVLTLIVAWSKRYALCCVNTCGCGPAGCCNKDGQSVGCCSTEQSSSSGCCGGK